MNLIKCSVVILVSFAAIALLVDSPVFQQALVFSHSEPSSEIWILGSRHMADNYPSKITIGENYTVFLDVKNHLGSLAHYMVQIKFQNQTQFTSETPVPSLYNVTTFIPDDGTWELPITFAMNYTHDKTLEAVKLDRITFNGVALDARGCSVTWDSQKKGFFGYLIFELWLYNSAVGDFQNHGRCVNLYFNLAA